MSDNQTVLAKHLYAAALGVLEQFRATNDAELDKLDRLAGACRRFAEDVLALPSVRLAWMVCCIPGNDDADPGDWFAYNAATRESVAADSRQEAAALCERLRKGEKP